ncbi:nuclease-related domain-containing protein [Virgibacillus sediminis]|uniref:Nuclease-related domain-containing protein n=1 Tax=Virgibacillus sediminis TaxID=202260 RepID=A0ABV7A480_9BACI
MLLFLNLFKNREAQKTVSRPSTKGPATPIQPKKTNEEVAKRKGEIGEYKIDIQLDQMPKKYRFLSDLLIENRKARSGYSQIDHVVITPSGVFVIETKNYQGTVYGGKGRKTWSVNGKFKMMNPFLQNYGHIQALKSLVGKQYHNQFISMVSFTKRSTFKAGVDYRKITSDELIVYDIELSEFVRRKVMAVKLQKRRPPLSENDISEIYQVFSKSNITDPKIREAHVHSLKNQKSKSASEQPMQCVVCKKVVSDKVKSFCLKNKKFEGKIYCYEHQKRSG